MTVHRNQPYATDDLKDNIQMETANIENNVLQWMADNICHLQMCPTEGGGHFKHLM